MKHIEQIGEKRWGHIFNAARPEIQQPVQPTSDMLVRCQYRCSRTASGHETDFFNGGLPVLEKYWSLGLAGGFEGSLWQWREGRDPTRLAVLSVRE